MAKEIKFSIITATYNSGESILNLINVFRKYKNEVI